MGHDLLAVLVADDQIDAGDVENLSGRGLRIAAGYSDDRFRIAAHRAADHLPAFLSPVLVTVQVLMR